MEDIIREVKDKVEEVVGKGKDIDIKISIFGMRDFDEAERSAEIFADKVDGKSWYHGRVKTKWFEVISDNVRITIFDQSE